METTHQTRSPRVPSRWRHCNPMRKLQRELIQSKDDMQDLTPLWTNSTNERLEAKLWSLWQLKDAKWLYPLPFSGTNWMSISTEHFPNVLHLIDTFGKWQKNFVLRPYWKGLLRRRKLSSLAYFVDYILYLPKFISYRMGKTLMFQTER